MLSPKEKIFVDAFREKLLLEADPMSLDTSLITSFIFVSDEIINNNYENRKEILEISHNLKKKCTYILSQPMESETLFQEAIDTIWALRLFEARNRQFDSYMLYLERNREPSERFYQPKRKQFWKTGIIPALQMMLDDQLDLLTISMPPGTGKAQPLYSKVLTPDGFVRMGDISIGDTVLSGTGIPSTVLGVFPQDKKDVYEFTLDGGEKFRCSTEHLCFVRWFQCGKCYEKVIEANEIIWNPSKYLLPVYKNGNVFFFRVSNVKCIGKEECQCIYIDDPSHLYITDDYIITHNSTISRFFMTGVIGWFPNEYNLFFSHSDGITRKYYDDALKIVTDSVEYTWGEIFPDLKVNHQNAKAQEFNVGKEKIFNSLQCSTRGSNNAGMVRASKFLLVDDLIAKIEEALNKATLEKLWGVYSTDARQRKTVDVDKKPCKEIHIATRWSVNDVIGKLQLIYGNDERCRFIAIPDIDPKTGKSNFDYDYQGFTEEFFHDIEKTMDDISYRCLYKNDPIEREGLLYHEEDLRRYYSLPNREPDAVLGVCDTKSTGIDYMVLPVMYQYGDDFYMVDCVCDNNTDFGIQKQRLTDIIVHHNMQQCEFESNAGGDRLAADVGEMVEKSGGRCSITTKATETNKETRIIVNSDWVKKHVLFKGKEDYTKKSDYGRFMEFLTTYSIAGRNQFDDVPDCIANFSLFVTRSLYRRKTRIMRSPI